MEYTEHGKNRRIKAKISLLTKRVSFQFLNLSPNLRVIFIGALITLFSLFFPWFVFLDAEKRAVYGNAFSSYLGYVGVILFVLTVASIALMLSNTHKEKWKARFPILVNDHLLYIFSGILIFTHTISSYYVVRGFTHFYSEVRAGEALVFALVGSLCMIGGGVLFYSRQKQETAQKLYMENSGNRDDDFAEYKDILGDRKSGEEKNMTLPI